MEDQTGLYEIIDAVKITSPDAFLFAGKNITAHTEPVYQHGGSRTATPLVKTLTDIFYQQCYFRKFNGSYHEQTAINPASGKFPASLSKANTTKDRWDKDWLIEESLQTGQFIATREGRYKFLNPGEFINAEYQSGLPRQGNKVSIHCPKESFSYQAAFYFVFSNEIVDQQGLFTLMRFYWNIKHTGAASLVGLITKSLNKFSIPFVFKILNNPGSFIRSDAAVLYVSKPYYHILAQLLPDVYEQIKDELNPDVPLFTKELSPGLSLAEDPENGESFGMSRCGMLAQGIFNAYEAGKTEREDIMQYVRKSFETNGILPGKPYLQPGSTDIYELAD